MPSCYRLCLIFSCVIILSCESEPQLKPLGPDAVILAFGDSLTYGTGAGREQSYPAQLQKLIDRTVINAGLPGEVSQQGVRRLPALLKQHRPDLVILFHGANDILRKLNPHTAKSNLQKMIMLIQQSGAQVILLAAPEFGLFLSAAPFYSELALENKIPLIDDALSDILLKPALKSDQVHPNADGYLVIALKIKTLLKKSGGVRQSSDL